MKLFNQLLNNKFNIFDKLSIFLFSILPISLIIGNASININILIIDILFLIYCLKFKLWTWIKKDIFLYLMILYVFLNLNSLYSYYFIIENQNSTFFENDSILRSLFFIKFILLVFAFTILLKKNKVLDFVHKNWLIIILVVIADVFFEKFTGKNIIGNISPDSSRIVSFFKDELVVGGFIFCFGYASISYFLNDKKNKNLTLLLMIIFLLIPLSIFVTGERSNSIRSILLFLTIIYFIKENNLNINYKVLLALFIFLISCFLIFNKSTRDRYSNVLKGIIAIEAQSSILNKFENIKYFAHYDTAIQIFKNYPILGVGNKNFRLECSKEIYLNKQIKFSKQRCSTHPHQIHFEILSEQGLLGYLLIIYLVIGFVIKNFKMFIKNKDISHLSNTGYLLIFFTPLLPGAGIFSTFNGSLFWIIFSLTNLRYEKK